MHAIVTQIDGTGLSVRAADGSVSRYEAGTGLWTTRDLRRERTFTTRQVGIARDLYSGMPEPRLPGGATRPPGGETPDPTARNPPMAQGPAPPSRGLPGDPPREEPR